MLKLAADADVPGSLVRALIKEENGINLVRVQDVHKEGTPDPIVLEWAASEGRILLTCDRNTMIDFALKRIKDKLSMPGLIVATIRQNIGDAEQEILLIARCCSEMEMEGQIVFLPLKSGTLRSSH